MRFLKNLNLTSRLHLWLSSFVVVIFLFLGVFLYQRQAQKIAEVTDSSMQEQVSNLALYTQSYAKHLEEKRALANQIIQQVSKNLGSYSVADSLTIMINANEVIDKEKIKELIAEGEDFQELTTIFEHRYYQSGFPFLLDKDGIYQIHPTNAGKDASQTQIVQEIFKSEEHEGKLTFKGEGESGTSQWLYFKYVEATQGYVAIVIDKDEIYASLSRLIWTILLIALLTLLAFNLVIWAINKELTRMINQLVAILTDMSRGVIVDTIKYKKKNEIGKIIGSLNVLIEGIRNTAEFSKQMGKGNLNAGFEPLSDEDILGLSLLEMRQSLLNARKEEKIRKEEDDKQKWVTNGLAKFGDILRQDNDNIENLSFSIISNLVKYLDANQGGLFIKNDENPEEIFFEMKAAFAYNKRKFVEKRIDWGEGVIGRCALEGEMIYMNEIPENYIEITSGLGGAEPKNLLIVPLKMDNEVYGVMEIASFKTFEEHQIEFVRKIAENIASTLGSVKINIKTAHLLAESEKQAKKLEQQEEVMRQNLEELRSTQEEAAKNEEEAMGFVNSVNHTIIRADYDTDGTLLYANTKLLEIMGYTASEVEGRHYSMFMDENELQDFNEYWQKLVKGGKHYEKEVQYKTKNGKIWLLATYTAVRDRKGKVKKVLYLAIDISKEKEKNLAYENDIIAIDQSIIKCEYDLEGNVTYANEVFLKILGFSRDELEGNNLFALKQGEKLDRLKSIWNQVLNGLASSEKEPIHSKDKTQKWFKGTYTPVKNSEGKIYKIIYIASEITEQIRLEDETQKRNQELQDSEEVLRKKMQELENVHKEMTKGQIEMQGLIHAINSSTYSLELDIDGQISKTNEAFAQAFGLEKSDIVGKNDKDFISLSDMSAEDYEQFWREVLFGIVKRKINRIKINERELWMSETYTPLIGEDKKVYKVIKISTDITKTKELELEATRQANELKAQEENLRKNFEELEKAQQETMRLKEEDQRKSKEMMKTIEDHRKTLMKIIDHVPGKVFLKDHEAKMLVINEQVAKAHGTSREELLGKSDFDFFEHEQALKYWNEEQEIIKGGKPVTFTQTEELGGTKKILQTTKMPFYIDYMGKTGLLGVQIDITELKKMEEKVKKQYEELKSQEEELRQNLEELQATQEDLIRKDKENQKIQEELQKEKYLMDALMNNLPDAIYFKDRDSKFIRGNKALLDLNNMKDHSELVGKSDFDLFARQHAQKAFNDEQNIIRTQEPMLNMTEREVKTDGAISWVSSSKMPLYDQDGNVVGTFGISRDISELKEMEVELRNQNEELLAQEEELRQNLEEIQATQEELERLKAEDAKRAKDTMDKIEAHRQTLSDILDHVPGKIFLKDHNSKMLLVNRQVARVHGVDAEELIGKSDFDFFDQEKAQELFEEEQQIIKSGKIQKYVQTEDLSGESRILETRKIPFHIPYLGKTGLLGVQIDITEQKQMELKIKEQYDELQVREEELRQNLEELQTIQDELRKEKTLMDALMDNIPDAIYFKDLDSKFIKVSRNMAANFKVSSPKEIIGKSDFDFFSAQHARPAFDDEQRIIKTKEPIIDKIEKETWEDGTTTWASTTKMPLFDADGKIQGTFGISRDITKLKQLETELLEQNEELRTQEEELRQNLEEIQATQEEMMRVKKEEEQKQEEMLKSIEDHRQTLFDIIDKVPGKIFLKDHNSKMLLVNNAVAKTHHMAAEELIGLSDFDFFDDPKQAQALFEEEQQIIKNKQPQSYVQKETLSGEERTLLTNKMPFYIPYLKKTGILGIQLDITERQRLEEEVKKLKKEIQQLRKKN